MRLNAGGLAQAKRPGDPVCSRECRCVSHGWAPQVCSEQDLTALLTLRLAAANAALAALAGGAADAPAAALEALKLAGLWPAVDRALPLHERRGPLGPGLGQRLQSRCIQLAGGAGQWESHRKSLVWLWQAQSSPRFQRSARARAQGGGPAGGRVRAPGAGRQPERQAGPAARAQPGAPRAGQPAAGCAGARPAPPKPCLDPTCAPPNQQLVVQARAPPCQNPPQSLLAPRRSGLRRQLLGQAGAPCCLSPVRDSLPAAQPPSPQAPVLGGLHTLWRARRC